MCHYEGLRLAQGQGQTIAAKIVRNNHGLGGRHNKIAKDWGAKIKKATEGGKLQKNAEAEAEAKKKQEGEKPRQDNIKSEIFLKEQQAQNAEAIRKEIVNVYEQKKNETAERQTHGSGEPEKSRPISAVTTALIRSPVHGEEYQYGQARENEEPQQEMPVFVLPI